MLSKLTRLAAATVYNAIHLLCIGQLKEWAYPLRSIFSHTCTRRSHYGRLTDNLSHNNSSFSLLKCLPCITELLVSHALRWRIAVVMVMMMIMMREGCMSDHCLSSLWQKLTWRRPIDARTDREQQQQQHAAGLNDALVSVYFMRVTIHHARYQLDGLPDDR